MSKESVEEGPKQLIQFRISTLLIVTLAATIHAAFLNPRGPEHMLACCVAVSVSVSAGFILGRLRGRTVERMFWGMVIAAMMQAVCANVILYHRLGTYAWPVAAGLAAVVTADDSNRYLRMILGGVTSGAVVAIYFAIVGAGGSVMLPMVSCAAIGGALLTVLIEFFQTVEAKTRIPQPAIGLSLLLASIAFSQLAPTLIPGW